MKKNNLICFVCKKPVQNNNSAMNQVVFLPVCSNCMGTDAEKKTEKKYLDSLADGFVCGCI